MEPEHLVYGLVDPRTNLLRYVGKSSSGLLRPSQHHKRSHLARDTNLKKVAWVYDLLANHLEYRIEVLENCTSEKEALHREALWILAVRSLGGDLLNLADGSHDPLLLASRVKQSCIPPYDEARLDWEYGYLTKLMEATDGNVNRAAKAAGLHRSTLYEKLAKAKITTDRGSAHSG